MFMHHLRKCLSQFSGPAGRAAVWSLVVIAALAKAPSTAWSAVVVSTIDDINPKNLNSFGAFEGLTNTASKFKSGEVTFDNGGVRFSGTSWSGFGYSQRTTWDGNNLYDNSNDLIAKPGIGAAGSQTWAVVGGSGTMTATPGYLFTSVELTNTLYTWRSMTIGDPFAGLPLRKGGGTGLYAGQDDFYTVRFTNTANSQSIDYNLADFRGTNSFVNDAWALFDLSSLAASQLSISLLGSRDGPFGLNTPSYVAMDNITVTAVPEPGSLLLIASVGGGLVTLRRGRRWLRGSP